VTSPRVSVVIPCHNAARWIGETIRSAASQTGVTLEIIVIDDGSTDDTVEQARIAGGERIQIIRQDNGGASRARNVGTKAARGTFIQYLDADDLLEPGTIARRVEVLDRDEADVAYCDWQRWEEDESHGFRAGETLRRMLGDAPELDLLWDHWWPPVALLYRRTLVDRVGAWREDLPIIQDARFLQDAALAGGRFAHVPGLGAKYRIHLGVSLSRRDPGQFLEDCFRNAQSIEARLTAEQALTPARRHVLARIYAHVARGSFGVDNTRFEAAVARVTDLAPSFSLDADRPLRALRRLVGYRRAEYVAGWMRQSRTMLRASR
jgi:glycosyltransferase involved in cell wall biosynthesis